MPLRVDVVHNTHVWRYVFDIFDLDTPDVMTLIFPFPVNISRSATGTRLGTGDGRIIPGRAISATPILMRRGPTIEVIGHPSALSI